MLTWLRRLRPHIRCPARLQAFRSDLAAVPEEGQIGGDLAPVILMMVVNTTWAEGWIRG